MRMWMIDPKLLCNKHLIGEHGEIHKHRHNFVKHHKISGRIKPVVQISPYLMEERHNELVTEMSRRDINHKSPYELPDLSYLSDDERCADVDVEISKKDLEDRCVKCAINIFSNNNLFN